MEGITGIAYVHLQDDYKDMTLAGKAASGHIAGVINPARRNRRNFWVNPALPPDAEAWFTGATSVPGSWWPAWTSWLSDRAGAKVPAPRQAARSTDTRPPPCSNRNGENWFALVDPIIPVGSTI